MIIYSKDGVSTLDLVVIQRHIVVLDTLDTPYKLLAADANGDGVISTLDLVFLQNIIVGLIDDIPTNTSWIFMPPDYEFEDPENPFFENWPTMKTYPNVTENIYRENWLGI